MNQLMRCLLLSVLSTFTACTSGKPDAGSPNPTSPACTADACALPAANSAAEPEAIGRADWLGEEPEGEGETENTDSLDNEDSASNEPQISVIPFDQFARALGQACEDLAVRKSMAMADQIDASISALSKADQAAIAEIRAALEGKDQGAIGRLYATLAMGQKISDLQHRMYWGEVLFLAGSGLRYRDNCDDFGTWLDLYQHSLTSVNAACVAELQAQFVGKYQGFDLNAGVQQHCREVDTARLARLVSAFNYVSARYDGKYDCLRSAEMLPPLPDVFLPQEEDCGEAEPEDNMDPTFYEPRLPVGTPSTITHT